MADLTEASSSGASTVTVAIGDAVVSKVATIARCFLDVERKDEVLSSKLQADIDEILSSTQCLHLSSSTLTLATSTSKADSALPKNSYVDTNTASPAFIGPAYRWLLQHIHNPYPPHDVKQSLALASGCSLNSVNSWFTNARKRMGWTSICRERFHGCRADAVDAAFRVMVQDDPDRPVGDELTRAFMEMKVAAEELYPSTLTKSKHEDFGIVRESPSDKTYEGSRMNRHMHSSAESVNEGGLYVDVRSLTSSPMPSLTEGDSSEDEEEVGPPPVAGKKRRVMCENQMDMSLRGDRPRKRLRSREHPVISPPMPLHVTSKDPNDASYSLRDVKAPKRQDMNYCADTTRKRWLSEVDVQGLPKDFLGPSTGPRIHAVSDPLPRATSETSDIDEWFNAHFTNLFEFPPPVSTELDRSLPWEVELYQNYYIPTQGDNSLQIPDNSSSSAIGMSDTLSDFQVGGVTHESDLPSLVDSHLLDLSNHEDMPLPSNSPSISCSPDSSIPTLSPVIDWAHLFSSNVDTTLPDPQLGDSAIAHLVSNTPFPDDDIFGSTSMLLANEQFLFERSTYLPRTSKVGATA